jgi:amidase
MSDDLVFQSARRLSRLLATRKVSAVELLRAYIAQIERVNPKVNAIVTFRPAEALKEARAIDARRARGAKRGPRAGLPNAYNAMIVTAGLRTTFGSPI